MNKFLLLLFNAGFIADPFPYDECNLVGREKGIKESTTKYWVAVQNKRLEGVVEVYLCTPYSFSDSEQKFGGWQHCYSSQFFRQPAEIWSEYFDEVPVCFKRVEE